MPVNLSIVTSDSAAHWLSFTNGVRAFVARRVPVGDVDDVTQDVLLRIHQSTDRMDEAERIEAWIFAIARRTVADFYRRRSRLPVLETSDAEPVADTEMPDVLFGSDSAHSVHEEVLSWLLPMAHGLPPMYADALIRADFQGQSQQQVADALGLSLSGAKSRIQRARVMLGEVLRACCDIDFGPDGRAQSFEPKHNRCEDCENCE